ncbi:MAG: universal stress protein family protein [Rhodobacteraceae bacterium HLUCCA12]|nr:MAG: universal stress protein family protein [Rhodobacteraceae bacterium HLUCCA12]
MPRPAIIAATDFSNRSDQVGARAAVVAAALDARLILAHAVDEPGDQPADLAAPGPDVALAGDEDGQGRLGRIGRGLLRRPRGGPRDMESRLQALARALGPQVAYRLLHGPPEAALPALARDEDALAIILGLHHERRVLDLLRLTTMERIVLESQVPVLIAHNRPRGDYRCVLAPTDFSLASAAALRMAARLAPSARFHAIHALQLPLGRRFQPGDATMIRAEQLRAAFLAMPGLPEFAEPPEIVPGGVHEVLAFRQNELNADLVCIGTHSGREPGRLGNYARDLMRAPPTDLLVSKPI